MKLQKKRFIFPLFASLLATSMYLVIYASDFRSFFTEPGDFAFIPSVSFLFDELGFTFPIPLALDLLLLWGGFPLDLLAALGASSIDLPLLFLPLDLEVLSFDLLSTLPSSLDL